MTTTLAPRTARRLPSLRTALLLDAVVTGANAAAYVAGFAVLDGVLGVPAGALIGLGVFLAAFTAFVAYVATRDRIHPAAATVVIELNVLWVVASIGVVAFDPFSATTLGLMWTALQALTVAGFALLQYAAARPR